jgi:hypothetical protein
LALLTERLRSVKASKEYAAIRRHYGDRRAERSGVLLMRHIDEGLEVLASYGADDATLRAYALHPLVQADEGLERSVDDLAQMTDDARVLLLAMEYRNIANQYLSTRVISDIGEIHLGPLPEVALMLKADKIQNYKDFLLYHRETHPRRAELESYFRSWLARLDISDEEFAGWLERLQRLST